MGLDALFSPRAVAVIGASNRELTIGYRIIENLMDFGYVGPIHPVNPKGGEIRGLKACRSILEVPGEVDVAHIVIKNTFVPACVEDCAKKGVKAVIINTAGFQEIGAEGAALEAELVAIARRTGIRVFGPNCQGVINTDPAVRAYLNFTFTRPTPGHISIVAQSGGVGEVIHQRITELGVGVRQYASNGNACDVSIPEILRHWGRDETTRVVIVHIESLADPRDFLEAATEVCRTKPVLAMIVGRTAEGARAVSSHTGGLMRQHTAIERVFTKAGIVAFRNIEEMCQAAIGFASEPVPAGNRVGMIANTGGPAIIATDELIENGMVMPPLSAATATALRAKLYPEASIHNPVDVLATAGPEHFAAALDALLADPGIDAIFLNFVTPFFVDTLGIAREIAAARARATKPIVATVMTEKKGWAETLEVIRASGVPCYDMPETGARVLAAMGRHAAFRRRPAEAPATFPDVDRTAARVLVEAAVGAGRPSLSGKEGFRLLAAYGIPAARCAGAGSVEECVAAADAIGYPVVLKVDVEAVLHKSDRGGVVLGIADRDQLARAAEAMLARFAAAHPRLLVQEQLAGGLEVIVGASAVEGLGHVVMFGLGGIHVEVLKDVSFEVTPVTAPEADAMIRALRSSPILAGVRGQPGVDRGALAEILQRASRLLEDHPEIRELDINPLLATPDGARAADVRVLFSPEPGGD
ncbi:MAG: acetate--CoA ligase family protein [Planctomycetes bacterium]|nr:acetate--CoA ligase family protein [Planctomycetota bacterium]